MPDNEYMAREAELLLDNGVLKMAFEHVRESTVQDLENRDLTDKEGREKLCDTLAALSALKETIYAYVENFRMENLKNKIEESEK